MGLFSGMYTKEGPGVPKNAPKKKGAARFFEIFWRDAGLLWKAGVLTALCFVPCLVAAVFTVLSYPYLGTMLIGAAAYVLASLLVGPALCGLHAVVLTTVRDEPCYMMHVYKKAWKDNARQSIPLGAGMMVLYAIELYLGYYYLTIDSSANYIMLAFVLFCLLLVTGCGLMAFLQVLFIDLPLIGILKNSIMLMFGFAKRTLPAALVILVGGGLLLGLVPWPMWPFAALLGLMAYLTLIADMWAWPAMEAAFQITERQAEKKASEAQAAALSAAHTAAKPAPASAEGANEKPGQTDAK